jgi:tripeptide aminopeptidase
MINQERLVKTFCDLVQIDSPSGEEEAISQDLVQRLEALGFIVKRDHHGNVIASEGGENPLMLSAHMDTVEPGRGIKPIVSGGRINTDGTTILGGDCKAGIAAILESLEAIQHDQAKRMPVQVVITRGEEIGLVGAKNLDLSLIVAKEGVVLDGEGPVSKVTIASPTNVRFDVRVTGRAAHAGVEPEKGISAIRIASEIIAQLPQGRIDEETTFNVGTIAGGMVRNAVPESTSFSGEFRSRNAKTLELMRNQVMDASEAARRRYPEADIHEEFESAFQMYSLAEDAQIVARVTGAIAALGMTPELGVSGGGSDANVFNLRGTPSVVVGIGTRDMHTTREHVDVGDLVDAARFCYALLTQQESLRE